MKRKTGYENKRESESQRKGRNCERKKEWSVRRKPKGVKERDTKS